MRACTKCGEVKPPEEFYVDRRSKTGRTSACKPCVRYQQRFQNNSDPEKRRERERRYHREQPGYSSAATRRWQEKNRERWLAQKKEYRQRTKEERAQKWAEYYEEHAEEVLAYKREAWRSGKHKKCKPTTAQRRVWYHRRRARLLEAFIEDVELDVLIQRDLGICGICRKPIMDDNLHIDHVKPLAAGGEHSYANTQLAHGACNMRKSAREDFTLAEPQAA